MVEVQKCWEKIVKLQGKLGGCKRDNSVASRKLETAEEVNSRPE